MKEQLAFYKAKLYFEIDAWDLSESLKSDLEIIIVDARSDESYQEEHIPKAINIPHRTITKETVSNLPHNGLIVCYCDGVGCNASTKAAFKLTELGFKVKELVGGLDWWKKDGYPTKGTKNSDSIAKQCAC